MADYEYDENLPYVVVTALGGTFVGRFARRPDAKHYAYLVNGIRVIDTTPKPRVPEDAKTIGWGSGIVWHATRHGGLWWKLSGTVSAVGLEDLPGVTSDTVFTVLDERKQ